MPHMFDRQSHIDMLKTDWLRYALGVNSPQQYPEFVNLETVQPVIDITSQGYSRAYENTNRFESQSDHTYLLGTSFTRWVQLIAYCSRDPLNPSTCYINEQNYTLRIRNIKIWYHDLISGSFTAANEGLLFNFIVAIFEGTPGGGAIPYYVDIAEQEFKVCSTGLVDKLYYDYVSKVHDLILYPGQSLYVGINSCHDPYVGHPPAGATMGGHCTGLRVPQGVKPPAYYS